MKIKLKPNTLRTIATIFFTLLYILLVVLVGYLFVINNAWVDGVGILFAYAVSPLIVGLYYRDWVYFIERESLWDFILLSLYVALVIIVIINLHYIIPTRRPRPDISKLIPLD